MENCNNCGKPYDDSFADWTICRECKYQLENASGRKTVYIDSLGISWTQEELEEAGGLSEVIRLNKEARI